MGRKLDDFCPVKDCRGRPTMAITYLDDYDERRRTAVCDTHWEQLHNKRPRHLGPPHKSVFKENIQVRDI